MIFVGFGAALVVLLCLAFVVFRVLLPLVARRSELEHELEVRKREYGSHFAEATDQMVEARTRILAEKASSEHARAADLQARFNALEQRCQQLEAALVRRARELASVQEQADVRLQDELTKRSAIEQREARMVALARERLDEVVARADRLVQAVRPVRGGRALSKSRLAAIAQALAAFDEGEDEAA